MLQVPKPFKTTALFTLISSLTLFANESIAQQEQRERVATKDLVEGIKSRDGRWFEVEMIIFERKDNQDFRENFENEIPILEKARKWDILRHQLQPDISLMMGGLEECHQDKNPLLVDETKVPLSPDVFFQKMMEYKTLINSKWQFTNELCLLPDESLSGYWAFDNDFTKLAKEELIDVPLEQVPEQVVAGDHDDFHDVYLLADQNLQLKEHFYTLKRNRNLNPLLHVGWRQPGLSKRRSIPVYLIAGKNYSEQYRYDGSMIFEQPEQNLIEESDTDLQTSAQETLRQTATDNVARFIQQLQSGAKVDFKNNKLVTTNEVNLPEQAWQLDGYVQIHLNHYLFINSEFNYREPSSKLVDADEFVLNAKFEPTNSEQSEQSSEADQNLSQQVEVNYLQNYYFKQNRRVYSGDIHYLDHPKFGILIQIRKYRH